MDDYGVLEEMFDKTQEIDFVVPDYNLDEELEAILSGDTIEMDLSNVVEEDVYNE